MKLRTFRGYEFRFVLVFVPSRVFNYLFSFCLWKMMHSTNNFTGWYEYLGLIGFFTFIVGTQCRFLKAAQRAPIGGNWGWWCCYHIIRQQGNWRTGPSRCTGIYPSTTIHIRFHELPTLSLLLFWCQLFFFFFAVQYTEGNLWRRAYCWNTGGSKNRSRESNKEREST